MTYVVAAFWRAKEGEEQAVLDLLKRVAVASEQEPGCLVFQIHRSLSDPAAFFLYEQFRSESALAEHSASDHVRVLVLEDAVHRLEERRRELYELA